MLKTGNNFGKEKRVTYIKLNWLASSILGWRGSVVLCYFPEHLLMRAETSAPIQATSTRSSSTFVLDTFASHSSFSSDACLSASMVYNKWKLHSKLLRFCYQKA